MNEKQRERADELWRQAAKDWHKADRPEDALRDDFLQPAVDGTYNWALTAGQKVTTDQAKGVAALLVAAAKAGADFDDLHYDAEEALGVE